ncbi:putative HNH endonuclease [Erwinia phage Hena1]|uniref:Putative HNH endonuclease n=1 Tax=Erwinia phage Hena1 TaxID=2678601 RepID=A0A6B9J9N6_9CAUD|nr:HNH endonuclease [Erwinia phage Hena1]QGZ16283.1 putative HNH endonuclease [Erwinia phage Hena1]
MDLHHLDEETKDANVSDLMRRGTKKLIAEMNKCVVLCANCHRKVHAGILVLPGR